MSSDAVAKTVAKKLRNYFEVKRLEDGFDLSGVHCPQLDHPPLKSRPTLNYDGLHDRPLKHYFHQPEVRVQLTQMNPIKNLASPREKEVKRIVKLHTGQYHHSHRHRRKSTSKKKQSPYEKSVFPEHLYRNTKSGRRLRPEYSAFGLPLKDSRKKTLKGGWPLLRSVPSHTTSRGETYRLINMATKMLVAMETVDLLQPRPPSPKRQTAPHPFETKKALPVRPSSARFASEMKDTTEAKYGQRPSTAGKYTYDGHGRRHLTFKAYDDSYDSAYTTRSGSGSSGGERTYKSEWPREKLQSEDEKHRNRQPIEITHRADEEEEKPPTPPVDKLLSHRNRPRSAKRRKPPVNQTIINVPDRDVKEEVAVTEGTQTGDSVGIQTEKHLLENYDHMEDEVKDGPWAEYQIYVCTGNTLGASTKADVKMTLYGEKGRTTEFPLTTSKNNKIKFLKGKTDLFLTAAHHVGKMRKVKIGHDRTELSYAWYLDNVTVYDMLAKRIYVFPCGKWLSGENGDQKIYRELPMERDRGFIDAMDESSESESGVKVGAERRDPAYSTDSDVDKAKDDSNSVKVNQAESKHSSAPKSASYSDGDSDSYSDSYSESDADTRTYSDDSSRTSSDSEVESSYDHTAKLSPLPQIEKKNSQRSEGLYLQPNPQKDDFFDTRLPGPTFTFPDSQKAADKANSIPDAQSKPQMTVNVETASKESSNTKESTEDSTSFMAGHKAGLELIGTERKQKLDEDEETKKQIVQGTSIHIAAKVGDFERVKQLIEFTPDVTQSTDENGWTPLHTATAAGQVDIVMLLAISKVNMNMETPTGYTAVHLAAMNGHVGCLMVLNARDAALTCRSTDMQTALHLAARGGHCECVKWLVANRAALDVLDNMGRTPLDIAEEYQHKEIVEVLRSCQEELANRQTGFAMLQSSNKMGGLETIEEDINSSRSRLSQDDRNFWEDDKEPTIASARAEAGSDDEGTRTSQKSQTNHEDLEVKKKLYAEQHTKMEESGMSFLDSIRQESLDDPP